MSDNPRDLDDNERQRMLELIRRAGQIQPGGLPAFTTNELADCLTGSATPELKARYEEALLNSAAFRRQVRAIVADIAEFAEAGAAHLLQQQGRKPADSKSPVVARVVAVITSIAAVVALVLLLPTREHSEWQLVDSNVAPTALLQSQTRGAAGAAGPAWFPSADSAAIAGLSRVLALDQGTIRPVLPKWVQDEVADSIPLTFVSNGRQATINFYFEHPQEQIRESTIWLLLFPSRQLQQMSISKPGAPIDLKGLTYGEAVAVVVFSTPEGFGHSSVWRLDFPPE